MEITLFGKILSAQLKGRLLSPLNADICVMWQFSWDISRLWLDLAPNLYTE